MARTLLPPNASLLERTVDETLPAGWAVMAGQVEPQANPPALLPWVAQHWQISQFESYFPTTQALLNAGLPWLRERGSAAAVRRAMGWLGYVGVKIEEDGALLHLEPGRQITNADLRRLAHVVRASIPLHVSFYRVYHRLDRRVLRLNRYPGLDNGLLQADSGTPVDVGDGTTIIVSQGIFNGGQAPNPRNTNIGGAGHSQKAGRVRRLDSWLLDCYRLGHPVRRPLGAGLHKTAAGATPAYLRLQPVGANQEGQTPANGIASPLGQPLGARADNQGNDLPRTVPDRTWDTGWWDTDTWQRTDIAGGATQLPDTETGE